MIAPSSRYGCGIDACTNCYGDLEWQQLQEIIRLENEVEKLLLFLGDELTQEMTQIPSESRYPKWIQKRLREIAQNRTEREM